MEGCYINSKGHLPLLYIVSHYAKALTSGGVRKLQENNKLIGMGNVNLRRLYTAILLNSLNMF